MESPRYLYSTKCRRDRINLKIITLWKRIYYHLGGESKATVQDIPLEIKKGNSERLSYESYQTKYINGKQSGVTDVGISGVSDNPDYLLEIDEGNKLIQITARADNTSGVCTLTQDGSGNQCLIHCTTPSDLKDNEILVTISRHPSNEFMANIGISSIYKVASDINFIMVVQYGVSPNDTRKVETTLNKGDSFTSINTPIQKEAYPRIVGSNYEPKEDNKYRYLANFT